jgi:hypothetical protein
MPDRFRQVTLLIVAFLLALSATTCRRPNDQRLSAAPSISSAKMNEDELLAKATVLVLAQIANVPSPLQVLIRVGSGKRLESMDEATRRIASFPTPTSCSVGLKDGVLEIVCNALSEADTTAWKRISNRLVGPALSAVARDAGVAVEALKILVPAIPQGVVLTSRQYADWSTRYKIAENYTMSIRAPDSLASTRDAHAAAYFAPAKDSVLRRLERE